MDSEAHVKEKFDTWYKFTFAVINVNLNLSKDTLKVKKICFSTKDVNSNPAGKVLPGAI